ncbi:hypothetical protein ACHAWO_000560 [Cyclotella atomus]|uniref:WSC domain-containing protein n=1 Tax=Cyclotella atomus TaxID=382360 RepID=A0ABD3P6R3_9STRA
MIRTLLSCLLTILPALTSASLYEKLNSGFCLPASTSGFTTPYHHFLHHSIPDPHTCSAQCDSSNAVYQDTHDFYRGFSFVKSNGDCYCYWDAGHLPPFSAFEGMGVTWEAEKLGSAQGEIGRGDGAEGVGCYKVIIRQTVS